MACECRDSNGCRDIGGLDLKAMASICLAVFPFCGPKSSD